MAVGPSVLRGQEPQVSGAVSEEFLSGPTTVVGHGGDQIEAYAALPTGPGPRGGVVVIHHMPGFDDATKEITRRFASMGYAAVCPNLHHREAPGALPDDASAAVRAAGGVPDERLVGDVGGAATFLRGRHDSNGRVGVIGFCSGGRQAVLAACSLDLQAAVDCYGAYVLAEPPQGSSWRPPSLRGRLQSLSAPLLGLFGRDDRSPAPAEVEELDRVLTDAGKPHEFHSFDGAGHAFFAPDRPSYRVEAAVQGWRLIRDFFARTLQTGA